MSALLQDFRQSFRSLWSTPGFVLLAVLCLGLGIGASTGAFSIVHRLVLQPVPLPEAERLVALYEFREANPGVAAPTSHDNFRDWQEALAGEVELAALRSRHLVLRNGFEPQRIAGGEVTWNLFETIGVRPLLGRTFREEDTRGAGESLALLGEVFWRQRYAADPAVIGREVMVEGRPRTVIGVVPHFAAPALPPALRDPRLWILLPENAESRRDDRSLAVFGRLAPDSSFGGVAARFGTLAQGLAEAHPENEGWRARMEPVRAALSPVNRALLLILSGAVGFVLLIACANVANMLLARAVQRRHELAIRIAAGATRTRIARLLLAQSLVIGLLAVPVGVLLASWAIELIVHAGPEQTRDEQLGIDKAVLAFAALTGIATSVLFGLVPALRASRDAAAVGIAEGGRSATSASAHRRLRGALVVSQVALAMMLLVCASLFVLSFLNLMEAEDELDTARLLALGFQLPQEKYPTVDSVYEIVQDIVERVRDLPGVQAAAASGLLPLRGASGRATARAGDGLADRDGTGVAVNFAGVTSAFFDATELALLQGEAWNDADASAMSPVAVINRTMAQRLWGDGNALGQSVHLTGAGLDLQVTVLGVAPDVSNWDQSNLPLPTAFLPFSLAPTRAPHLLLRVEGDPASAALPARSAVLAADQDIAVFSVSTMDEVRRLAFWRQQLVGVILSAVAALAMLLSVTGVFGVLSYLVAQRTAELGIRMALGAARRSIVSLVLRQGAVLTLIGMALGTAGSLLLIRALEAQLYGLEASKPGVIGGAAGMIIAAALAASFLPAWRASRVDPSTLLRRL